MEKEIKKVAKRESVEDLKKERQEIVTKIQALDQQKNASITRLAEIQGIIKYLAKEEQKDGN